MLPWLRIPKSPFGKSFAEEVREAGLTLPSFDPERPLDRSRPKDPVIGDPRHFPFPLVYGEPLPPNFDDRYGRSLSARFLIFERDGAIANPHALFADELCSGFLSDGILPADEAEPIEDEAEPTRPLVDDSATESHDDEAQNPSSAQSPSPSLPSKSSAVTIVHLRSDAKVVNLREETGDAATAPSTPRREGSAAVPEPLKGKSCVVISTQGSYQPLYHEFADSRSIPKIHLFYFDGYSQSPYDVPVVNVDRYLAEKQQLRDRKRTKDVGEAAETVVFCEICKTRIKTTPEEHRASTRHQTRVARLDWADLDGLSAFFAERFEI
jgi:hypothetical protein